MIHDVKVEVTCDGPNCRESVDVILDYVYGGTMHTQGRPDDDERKIEKKLASEYDWIVRDGSHYCSEECAESEARDA